jgi:hypothetical protein
MREAFDALSPTWRALIVIVTAVSVGAIGGTVFNRITGLPHQHAQLRAEFEQHRVQSRARYDSLALVGLQERERMRTLMMEADVYSRDTRRILDEFICALSAAWRGEDPVAACREPLPFVPFGPLPPRP